MIAAELYKMSLFLRGRRLVFLKDRLKSIPYVSIGKRRKNGIPVSVIRAYLPDDASGSGEMHRVQYDLTSRRAHPLLVAKEEREELERKLNSLRFRSILDVEYPRITTLRNINPIDKRFSKEVFDQLEELKEDNPVKKHYFDGHIFRSKSELIVAQFLKSLGLEYKYEAIVKVGEQVYYVDFAVYCPETGRFFFIEHLGMMSKDSYRMKNFAKITNYILNGYVEGLDVLFIFEHGDDRFSADAICGKILGVIAAQARQLSEASVL